MRPPALNLCLSLASVLVLLAPGRACSRLRPQRHPRLPPNSEHPPVIEHDDSICSYNADGTGYRERTMVVRVQSEAALRNWASLPCPGLELEEPFLAAIQAAIQSGGCGLSGLGAAAH